MPRTSKLKRYQDNKSCNKLIEEGKPLYAELKGRWNELYFQREAPISVELGCGKGEYILGLARRFVDRNFIGMDRKGAPVGR